VTAADVRAAQTLVRPSALREQALELPAVRWADVGGLADVKQRLAEAVEWPQRHPDALARLGARVRARAAPRPATQGRPLASDSGRAGVPRVATLPPTAGGSRRLSVAQCRHACPLARAVGRALIALLTGTSTHPVRLFHTPGPLPR